eukprot:3699519-Rhodomonas_salina.1
MSGTDLRYGATVPTAIAFAESGTNAAYVLPVTIVSRVIGLPADQVCPYVDAVVPERMRLSLLRACYAMSGTDLAYSATRSRPGALSCS